MKRYEREIGMVRDMAVQAEDDILLWFVSIEREWKKGVR